MRTFDKKSKMIDVDIDNLIAEDLDKVLSCCNNFTIQPLVYGYKVRIKNGEITYKHQNITSVNRILNKYVDKLYTVAQGIKNNIPNCFLTLFEDTIFIDIINCSSYTNDAGFEKISHKKYFHKKFNTIHEIVKYLYNQTDISEASRNAIFGFKLYSEDKSTIYTIKVQGKEKEKFVIDDTYKFWYNTIMNLVASEFKNYPERYNNNIERIDERIIWISTHLSSKILLLDPRFYDDHLVFITKPFEHIINYTKMPDFVIDNKTSRLFSIILAILHNKSIKSGFIKSGSDDNYHFIQKFIDDSYCKFIYFEDKYNIKQRL